MGWFSRKAWSVRAGTKTVSTMAEIDSSYFYPINSSASYSPGSYNNITRLAAFTQVPEVNAIFNLRARAAGNINIGIVDKNGKEVQNGEKLPEDWLIDLVMHPNYFQSKEEFFGQTTLFRDIFGNEFVYAFIPVGFTKPTGIFSLPSQNVEIKDQSAFTHDSRLPFYTYAEMPGFIEYWYNDMNSKSFILNKGNLLHLNDNRVSANDLAEFYMGMSKLDALQAPIANIVAAYEARNVLIVNRGAIGILSNASKDGVGGVAPMMPKEKQLLQDEFKKYGLTKNQWQVIITNLALNWQQMAIDVDKMKLFEECKEDTLKICDSYGTPYEMLSSIRNTTFDNKKEAQRQWYRDTIIPEANARIAGINRKFKTTERGYRLIPKFDHLPIFESEKKERAQSLMYTINALTKALEDGAISIEQYKDELKKFGI